MEFNCKTCKFKKKCRGRISKGSRICKERLGLLEKREETHYHPHIVFWALYNYSRRNKNVSKEGGKV